MHLRSRWSDSTWPSRVTAAVLLLPRLAWLPCDAGALLVGGRRSVGRARPGGRGVLREQNLAVKLHLDDSALSPPWLSLARSAQSSQSARAGSPRSRSCRSGGTKLCEPIVRFFFFCPAAFGHHLFRPAFCCLLPSSSLSPPSHAAPRPRRALRSISSGPIQQPFLFSPPSSCPPTLVRRRAHSAPCGSPGQVRYSRHSLGFHVHSLCPTLAARAARQALPPSRSRPSRVTQ